MQQLGWLALSAQISYTVTLEQQTVVQQHNDVNMQCKQFCTHNASWPGGGTVQHLGPNCLCQNVRTHHKPFIGFWQPRKAGLSIQTGKSCIHKIHKPVPRCLSAELSQVWSARLRNWVLTGTIFSSLWVTVRYLKQSWVFIITDLQQWHSGNNCDKEKPTTKTKYRVWRPVSEKFLTENNKIGWNYQMVRNCKTKATEFECKSIRSPMLCNIGVNKKQTPQNTPIYRNVSQRCTAATSKQKTSIKQNSFHHYPEAIESQIWVRVLCSKSECN